MYRLSAGASSSLCRYDGYGAAGICSGFKTDTEEGTKKCHRRGGSAGEAGRRAGKADPKSVKRLQAACRAGPGGARYASCDHFR